METSNWRPNQSGDSSIETVDWRTQMPPDLRQKIINKIMDHLKKHAGEEKLHEVKNIAMRFEEKIYTSATSQEDYIRKISLKIMAMESRSANPVPNPLQSNSACNTVNPSDPGSQGMQQVNNQGQPPHVSVPSNHPQAGKQILPQSIHNNVSSSGVPAGSGISHSTSQHSSMQNVQNISVGNNMGHGIPPSNFVSQRQIPVSQNSPHYLYQQQSPQIAKQKLQQNNVIINNNNTTSVQSHIQQQHQNLLQPTHFQPSQLQPTMLQPSSLSTIKQNQQSHFPQSGQPMSQHHQQLVLRQQRHQQQQPRVFQQNNLSSVQSIGQLNNFSAIRQQHLGPQSCQKSQQSLGTQSGNSTILNNQHSSHLIQSTQGQRSQLELQQQVIPQLQTQSAQFQPQLNMKQRLPAPFHQQRVMPEASSTSSESTAQTGNPNSGDWQEELYQKVKAMKDKYFPELSELYQRYRARLQQHDSFPQQLSSDQLERLKRNKQLLDFFLKFLQLPKNNLSPNHKEKLVVFEREIVNLIGTHKRKPGPTLQQQRMNSLQQSQQTQIQYTHMQPHENQMNSQMQSANLQHNNLASLRHNSVSNVQQNMMGMLQQPNSNMLPHQQLKQLQSRQMQQQIMHKQQLLHHHQFQPQSKHNAKLKVNQVSQLHQINDGNELNIKQQVEMKSESLKQLKVDQQNVLNSVTKSSTPVQPANSPFIVSSPSTPSTSNLPGDTDKINSSVSYLDNDGNICTPGISASPLLAECTNTVVNHANDASFFSGKSTVEQPLEQLIKVVKSMSQKSLSASARDIGSVVSVADSIAGSAAQGNDEVPGVYDDSRTEVFKTLVAMTKETITGKRKMKRFPNRMFINLVSSASSVDDSFNHLNYLENSEMESTATSTIKRPRVEMRNPLLEEIREINQGLIDTVVDISQENADPDAASEVGAGTIVKCSFSAVALCPNLKSHFASLQTSPIQPLRLLVPANYPKSSPVLLDELPVEVRKEYEDLSIKAQCRFSSCIRRLSDPMSLEKMVRTWDACAHAVISECVQQSGGGTFTSKYGAWEDCLTAA